MTYIYNKNVANKDVINRMILPPNQIVIIFDEMSPTSMSKKLRVLRYGILKYWSVYEPLGY